MLYTQCVLYTHVRVIHTVPVDHVTYQHVDEEDGHDDHKDNPEGEGDGKEGDLLLCVALSIGGLAEH